MADELLATEDPALPGRFPSPLANYPGYVRLPAPFLGRHYKAWYRASEAQPEGTGPRDIENKAAFQEWRAAFAVVLEWKLDGLPPSDIDASGDNVPAEVLFWVKALVIRYIADKLDPKHWRAPSAITPKTAKGLNPGR